MGSATSVPLQRMDIEQKFCDATIEVGDRKLSVHRCVLAVQSRVFDRMFAAGLQETHSHIIEITDFQYEPVRALIEYMYMPDKINTKQLDTDRLEEDEQKESSDVGQDTSKSDDEFSMLNTIHEFTEDVLALADKYDVKPLKNFCEQLLTRRVDENNLCEMAVVADTFKCERLTAECTRLLVDEHATVRKSAQWTRLKREHPELYVQLLEGLCDSFTK